MIRDVGGAGEGPLASFDAAFSHIDHDQVVAIVLQIPCPASESRGYFQDCMRRNEGMNARENGAEPLGFGATPRGRPFLPLLRPVVAFVPLPSIVLEGGHEEMLRSEVQAGEPIGEEEQ